MIFLYLLVANIGNFLKMSTCKIRHKVRSLLLLCHTASWKSQQHWKASKKMIIKIHSESQLFITLEQKIYQILLEITRHCQISCCNGVNSSFGLSFYKLWFSRPVFKIFFLPKIHSKGWRLFQYQNSCLPYCCLSFTTKASSIHLLHHLLNHKYKHSNKEVFENNSSRA